MQERQTKMLIHLLVRDDEGEVYSGTAQGAVPVGTKARYRFACRPAKAAVLDDLNRATTEPWAVRCDACKATADFKAIERPRPGTRGSTDMVADGCCD